MTTKTRAVRAHVRRSPSKSPLYIETHAKLSCELAMEEAASEIASWAGRFVPLEQIGVDPAMADRLKETW